MSDTPQAYPLAWPQGRPRRKVHERKIGRFTQHGKWITVAGAMDRLEAELGRLGAKNVLLSSDIPRKLDGDPRSGTGQPDDRGVCVYFTLTGKPHAMACDAYTEVQDNIAALAAHIEAVRAIERHGVATSAETLQAFTALPPPGVTQPPPSRPWWEIFGVMRERATEADIQALYRVKAKAAAGDEKALLDLNLARDAALADLRRAA